MATVNYLEKYALLKYSGAYYFVDNKEIRLTSNSNALGEVWVQSNAVEITSQSEWDSYTKGSSIGEQSLAQVSGSADIWFLYTLGKNKYRKKILEWTVSCFNRKGNISSITEATLKTYTEGPSIS